MTSTGRYLKWANRLAEELSSKPSDFTASSLSYTRSPSLPYHSLQQNQNQMSNTYYRPADRPPSLPARSHQQNYSQMANTYYRCADSLERKRNSQQGRKQRELDSFSLLNTPHTRSQLSIFDHVANMDFVKYRHHPHQNQCAQECQLKKKSKKLATMQKKSCCCNHKPKEQNKPTIIKEIHTVYVQAPPTINREFVRPLTPVNFQQQYVPAQPRLIPQAYQMPPQVHYSVVPQGQVINQSPSHSPNRVSFNHAPQQNIVLQPQAQLRRSVIVVPNKPVNQQYQSSPFQQLQSPVRYAEQPPRIMISEPPKKQGVLYVLPWQSQRQPQYVQTSHFIQSEQQLSPKHSLQAPSFRPSPSQTPPFNHLINLTDE